MRRMRRMRRMLPVLVGGAVLVSVAGAGTGGDVLPPGPAVVPAGPVLAEPASSAPVPTTAGLGTALGPLLADPALGPAVGALVLDGLTGTVLLDRDSQLPRVPASAAKLMTAAAALVALGPQRALQTRVVEGAAPGEIVLVGAGDPTLTAAVQPPEAYPRDASLAELAAQTAAALRSAPTPPASPSPSPPPLATAPPPATPPPATAPPPAAPQVVIRVDDSLFAGPPVNPAWEASYLASGTVAPVYALAVDGGRIAPGGRGRSPDPALAAGQSFADLLRATGLPVGPEITRTVAPLQARELASVASPTIAVLVEQTLSTSDNDVAEALLHLAAAKRGFPATPAGGAATVAAVLAELTLPGPALLLDGSGLARGSRISPAALAHLLVAAGGRERVDLWPLVTGLPVAAFSGTLADRFGGATPGPGAGFVRAKTGTLTGVSSLAGVVEDADGRLLVFAVLADAVPATGNGSARVALDRIGATLAACGCR
jgi:D-alanyl-D-alanine carboxypeptidase/D-alanyl-D-alanine-endopeptidase (penicillin-binding protein 4)